MRETIKARGDVVITLSADGDVPFYLSLANYEAKFEGPVFHLHMVHDGFPVVTCANDIPRGFGAPLMSGFFRLNSDLYGGGASTFL